MRQDTKLERTGKRTTPQSERQGGAPNRVLTLLSEMRYLFVTVFGLVVPVAVKWGMMSSLQR